MEILQARRTKKKHKISLSRDSTFFIMHFFVYLYKESLDERYMISGITRLISMFKSPTLRIGRHAEGHWRNLKKSLSGGSTFFILLFCSLKRVRRQKTCLVRVNTVLVKHKKIWSSTLRIKQNERATGNVSVNVWHARSRTQGTANRQGNTKPL